MYILQGYVCLPIIEHLELVHSNAFSLGLPSLTPLLIRDILSAC